MLPRVALVTVIFATLLRPTVARAGQEPAAAQGIRVGPVSLSPTLTVTGIGIDSNVYSESVEPKSDFTATFSPRLDARAGNSRLRLTATTGWDFRYFRTYRDQRGSNTSNEARIEVSTARFTPYVRGALLRTYDRQDLEVYVRAHRTAYRAAAGTTVRVSPKLSLDISGEQGAEDYGQADQLRGLSLEQQLNRTNRQIDYTARYELTPLTSLSFSAIQQHTAFEFAPDRDSTGLRTIGGVTFKPFAVISGTVRAGVLRFNPASAALPSFVGPVAALDLGYTFRGATRVGLTLDRDLGYSVDDLQTYYLQTGIGVSVLRQLSPHWSVSGNASRQRLTTRTIRGTAGSALTEPDARGRVLSATVGYRLSPTVRLGLIADATQRQGGRGEDFDGVRVSGMVTYALR